MPNLLDELKTGGADVQTSDHGDSMSRQVIEGCTWGNIDVLDIQDQFGMLPIHLSKLRIYRGWYGRFPDFVHRHELITQHLGMIAGLAAALLIPGGLWIGMIIAAIPPAVYFCGIAATLTVPLEYMHGSTTDQVVTAICAWIREVETEDGECQIVDGRLRRDLLEIVREVGTPATRFWFTLRLPHTSHSSR